MSAGKVLAQIGHAALMADPDPGLDVNVVGAGDASGRGSRGRPSRSSGTAGSPSSHPARRPCSCCDEGADRQPVRERRHGGKARGRRGRAAGRNRDAAHGGAGRRHRLRGRVVSASGGDLRLLRRRDLQRGSQRPPRRRRRGFRPGRRPSVLPRALGFPRDPVRAAERIRFGKPRRISLGRINGGLFAFNAGIGLDAELVRRVEELGRREDGKRPGRPRLRDGRSRARWRNAASAIRSRSRWRGSDGPRSHSSRTARRTPTRAAWACASPRTRPSREAWTSAPPPSTSAPRGSRAWPSRPFAADRTRASPSSATTSTGS